MEKQRLTRQQAEDLAIKNNPRVSIARLLALAQHQVYRETRSAELPTANAAVTAVKAEDASRISAGSLTASRLFEHGLNPMEVASMTGHRSMQMLRRYTHVDAKKVAAKLA